MQKLEETNPFENEEFERRARKTIKDMGDRWNPVERKRFVKSLATDYKKLCGDAADTFIGQNGRLIEEGDDER